MIPCKILQFVHLLARYVGNFVSSVDSVTLEMKTILAYLRGYNLEKQAGNYLQFVNFKKFVLYLPCLHS